ncbi:hypothetical protein LCGC14_2254940 [marine sediment metagenome]|uniref:SAM-dependent methyltransferase TRM5/TYW2-type domain-containing protein n=1 Tax=marine sediment metagenome TaxID=412755 RepID=A0A0F9D1S7_9ZZZZ
MGINNKPEIKFLMLKKRDAQQFITSIKGKFKNVQIINQKYKILYENEYILFPLVDDQDLPEFLSDFIEKNFNFKLIYRKGIQNLNFKHRSLQEALKSKIPERYLDSIPQSYDIIGDIAILEFDASSLINSVERIICKKIIANAIIDVNKNVRSVFEKKSEIKGNYRLRELAFLAGENKSETIHKENDCIFKLDVKETYFSPRLVFERRRISTFNMNENEVIIDMFSGVGPFSIQIANINNVIIYAFDINPCAYQYLKENIELNKLKGKITPHNINIKDLTDPKNHIGKILHHKADRLIMNLPEKALDFINTACYLMKKSGGILHFYHFSEKPNPIERVKELLKIKLEILNWNIEKILNSKVVKSYSPKKDLIVLDIRMYYLEE